MTNEELAMRATAVRRNIVKMLTKAGSGHPGGSLSVTDILTVLYFDTMDVTPSEPHRADRDRFVLSKGHAAPALYAVSYGQSLPQRACRHIDPRRMFHIRMALQHGTALAKTE